MKCLNLPLLFLLCDGDRYNTLLDLHYIAAGLHAGMSAWSYEDMPIKMQRPYCPCRAHDQADILGRLQEHLVPTMFINRQTHALVRGSYTKTHHSNNDRRQTCYELRHTRNTVCSVYTHPWWVKQTRPCKAFTS